MARSKPATRRHARLLDSIWTRAAAGLFLWAGGTSFTEVATAQTPERTEIVQYHLNKSTIQLPIQLDEQFRPILQEIRLYSKDRLSAPWKLRDKAPPSQTAFTFKAPQDGQYWFMMVTVDRAGHCVPADVAKEEPAMAVVVDTQPPQADVTLLANVPEGQLIQCDVRDAHLDVTKTRVQYQTADRVFRDLAGLPNRPNVYCIPAQANVTGQIRVIGADHAGNVVTRECNLAELASSGKAPSAAQAPMTPSAVTPVVHQPVLEGPQLLVPDSSRPQPVSPMPMPPAEKAGPKLLPGALSTSPALNATSTTAQSPPSAPVPTSTAQTVQKASGTQAVTGPNLGSSNAAATSAKAALAPTIAAKREGTPAHHLLVNSTRVFLEYRVEQAGPSGVGRVEVWCTHDSGQTWQRIAENHDRKSPAAVQLPGDGVYGLTLVVSNGLGFGAQPPAAGNTPDWWVEVDTTQPVAQITTARLSTEDGPAVHLGWTSKDRNLGSGPVDLSYAINRQGPWLPIAKGLKGEGQFRWRPPSDIGAHAFFRLTVRDLAGNTTLTETTEPVALDDLSRPRAFIAGITTDTGTTPVAAPRNDGH
jgi:hypothetical protein